MNRSIPVIAMCGLAFPVYADQPKGGFQGPDNLREVTAAQALELADDTEVKLTGHITKSLGDEKYEFRDDSGSLTVEIDDDDWNGLEVTPELRVHIAGEIEQEWQETEVEAEWIRAAE